jgi:hypothetical protein
MKFGFLSLMRRRPEIGWGCRFSRLSISVKQAISNLNNAGSSLMSAAIPYMRQLPIENARWERRYDRFADARFLFRTSAHRGILLKARSVVSDAHHIVAQQRFFALDFIKERLERISCIEHAHGPWLQIRDRHVLQSTHF